MNKPLNNLLDNFHSAILQNDAAPILPAIKPNDRMSSARQMNIYIEGYRLRLISTIRSDYPILLQCLGEKTFDGLALNYIEQNPSTGYNLDRYPHAFAAYVCTQIGDSLARDLVTLEGAIAEVFMMPESAPLSAKIMAGITPDAFAEMVMQPRSASRLLRFDTPVEEYFLAARAGGKPENFVEKSGKTPEKIENTPEKSCFLFVLRHQNEVKRHVLTQNEAVLLEKIINGLPVGIALESVATDYPDTLTDITSNLQNWFARWIEHGFFKEVT